MKSGLFLRELTFEYLHKTILAAICLDYYNSIQDSIKDNSLMDSINADILQQVLKNYEFWYLYLKKENLLHIDEVKPLLSVSSFNY